MPVQLNNYRTFIADEFAYAADMMKKSEKPEEKMFFFSSTYGLLARIFNFEFDPLLVFVHTILNTTYLGINSKLHDPIIKFSAEYWERLSVLIEKLGGQLESRASDLDIYRTLQDITLLAFMSTGNGYFLHKKNVIKIEPTK